MQLTIDTRLDSPDDMRAAAMLLLHLVGDLDENESPNPLAAHTHTHADTHTGATSVVASGAANTSTTIPTPPTVPAPVSNTFIPPPPPVVPVGTGEETDDEVATDTVGNVATLIPPPPPPPPPSVNTAATTIPAPPVPSAGVATTVVSVDGPSGVDSAGMPYDKRIHQKTGNKKKDGTWKLIKGIDPAVVAAVTAELAASKGAAAPVLLPGAPSQTGGVPGSVPVPPVPNATPVANVPAPPAPPVVPVPPVAAVGAVPAVSPYRALIERITVAAKAGQITPARVNELCQLNGVPNLMQLDKMPEKFDVVCAQIDAAIAGLG